MILNFFQSSLLFQMLDFLIHVKQVKVEVNRTKLLYHFQTSLSLLPENSNFQINAITYDILILMKHIFKIKTNLVKLPLAIKKYWCTRFSEFEL